MEFIEVINKRHSVRKYSDKKVEDENLKTILETAHLAPTDYNLQPRKIMVIRTEEGVAS